MITITVPDTDRISSANAAKLLGVSDRMLMQWRRDGYGPSYFQPTAKRVYYRLDDINAWIEAHMHHADLTSKVSEPVG